MIVLATFLLLLFGVSVFIMYDLYKAGLRSFKQFDWRRYWNTNQMRLVMLILGAISITIVLWLLKAWMDALVAQFIAITGGIGTGVLSKKIDKNSTVTSRPSILSVMEKEIGVTEVPGPSSNPRILKYAKDLGYDWYKNDDTAWCALIVGWSVWRTGRAHTGSLMAKSYLNWGQPATAADIPSGNVIAVFHRGRAGAATGHVGVVIAENGNTITLLSGNYSNKVAVGPYKKDAKFLGYRKPND